MSQFRWKLTLARPELATVEVSKLTKDPKGWQDTTLSHIRDSKYHGVFYEVSVDLAFFCKGVGKELIDKGYDLNGTEANIVVELEAKCNGTFSLVYTGKADMSTYRQEYQNKTLYTFISFIKNGLTETIRNREDVDIDITSETSLDGIALNSYFKAPYDIHTHSKLLRYTSCWSSIEDQSCLTFPTSFTQEITAPIGMNVEADDLKKTISVQHSTIKAPPPLSGTQAIVDTTDQDLVYPISATVEWDIQGTFTDTGILPSSSVCGEGSQQGWDRRINTGSGLLLLMWVGDLSDWNLGISIANNWVLFNGGTYQGLGNAVVSVPFATQGSVNITLQKTDRVYLFWAFQYKGLLPISTRDSIFNWEYDTFKYTVTADTTSPDTTVKAVAIHEAWSRVSEGITSQPLAFKSELFGRVDSQGLSYPLNGCASFTSITNGRQLRGKSEQESISSLCEVTPPDTPTAAIRCNLVDMFDSCNAIWNIGLGLDDHEGTEVVRVEDKAFFYSETVIFTAANISALKMDHDNTLAPTEVEVGFEKWETERINGIDEPLTSAVWTLKDIRSYKNKVQYLSPYIASMYAIEVTRRYNAEKGSSTDWKYDDDNFLIAMNRTIDSTTGQPTKLDVPEKNENINVVVGTLISPETAYNLRFLLFNNLQRLGNIITTGLTKLLPSLLVATQDKGNPDVRYTLNSNQDCDADITGQILKNVTEYNYDGDRTNPIFLPEVYTFDFPVSFSEYSIIRANPKGKIRFSDNSSVFMEGWIRSLAYNLHTKMATFEVIRKFEG